MDEIYEQLDEAEILRQQSSAGLTNSLTTLTPYPKVHLEYLLEGLPLTNRIDLTLFAKLEAVVARLQGERQIKEGDILTVLLDYEPTLSKYLLLLMVQEKLDFAYVLNVYLAQKIKKIRDNTIQPVELLNIDLLVRSGELDHTIVPPSMIEKHAEILSYKGLSLGQWMQQV